MAVAAITGVLNGLGASLEGLGTEISVGAGFASAAAAIVELGPAALLGGLLLSINSIVKVLINRPALVKAAQEWVTTVNSEVSQIYSFAAKPLAAINVDSGTESLVKAFFPGEIEKMNDTITNYNNVLTVYKKYAAILKTNEKNGKLLQANSFGNVVGMYNILPLEGGDRYSIIPVMDALYNMGIVDSPDIIKKIFNAPTGTQFDLRYINPTTGIIDITRLMTSLGEIEGVISKFQGLIETYKSTALAYASTGSTTINPGRTKFPTMPQNGWYTPFPTVPLIPIYTPFPSVDLNKLINGVRDLTDTESITKTATKTVNEEEEDNKKKKKKKKIKKEKKTSKEHKRVQFIQADVSSYSDWIQYVNFEFDTRTKKESNKKGQVSITLKSGESYNLGRYKRGVYSNSIITTIGAGYGYWRNFNYNMLVRTDTVSYNLPRPSLQRQLKAISKEIKQTNITYR